MIQPALNGEYQMIEKLRNLNFFKGITVGVCGVSIANMLIAISTTMTFSISPFFITQVLGLSMLSLGMVDGICEGIAQISKLLSGYSGDVFRRKKPPLMFGAFLATISKPIFILAGGIGAVVAAKVLERISNGVIATPRDAYVAAASHDKSRGKSIGLSMTLKTLGCCIGSLFMGFLIMFTTNFRILLWYGFVPCALSLVVLYMFMPEKKIEDTNAEEKSTKSKANQIRWTDFKELSTRYWSLIFVATLFMCARFNDGFLILRLDEMGAPKSLSASTIGIFNILSSICCLPIGHWSDRIDRSKLLYLSFIALIVSNLCFITNSLSVAIMGIMLWGVQRGTSQVLFCAIIADEAPKKIMGTAMGIFYLVTGVIAVVAGTAAGSLSDISLKYAFYFGLVVSSLSLLVLIIRNQLLSRQRKRTLTMMPVIAD